MENLHVICVFFLREIEMGQTGAFLAFLTGFLGWLT